MVTLVPLRESVQKGYTAGALLSYPYKKYELSETKKTIYDFNPRK